MELILNVMQAISAIRFYCLTARCKSLSFQVNLLVAPDKILHNINLLCFVFS
jgi:hypothetical protein